MSQAKTAFVTGASRGIGKVVAIWLAKAGFDVCVTARSVEPGEQREHSPSASRSDTSPLPGSLSETLAAIEALGRRVMALPADITDPASISAAGTTFLERWGAPDVLVNCARHTGPGQSPARQACKRQGPAAAHRHVGPRSSQLRRSGAQDQQEALRRPGLRV